ncbi:MAG: cysteine hydrolase [Solobacterium sp.]|jgi:nicotinamidase-related amidase|nr:cysteine hydrolase [Solobacterium sp.]
MKKLLIVVDLQNDFVDAALGTKEAEAIVPFVADTIRSGAYDYVIATMDTHMPDYMNTLEGHYLPVEHCVRNTPGWQLQPEVRKALEEVHAEIIEKPTFGSYALAERVQRLAPEEIVLVGLCTDICVISNALLLRAGMYNTKITVLKDGCAATTPEKHIEALHIMESCQIEVK